MPRYGIKKAIEYHESNTGPSPFVRFSLKKSGDKAKVRFLAGTPKEDENNNQIFEDGKRYIPSLFYHKKYQMVNERCLVDQDNADPNVCPLCRVKAPRTLLTFIPLRERGDTVPDRWKYWVVGREMCNTIASAAEEIPGHDLTAIDFIIKRVGDGTSTKYELYPQDGTRGPLGPKETALEWQDPDDLIPLKSDEEVEKIAVEYDRAANATRGGGNGRVEEDEAVPF